MGEHNTHSSSHTHTTHGFPKGTSIKDVCKAYKSLIMRWQPDKNSASSKTEDKDKLKSLNEAYFEHRSVDDQFYMPSFLLGAESRRCQSPSPNSCPFYRSRSTSTTSTSPSEPSIPRSMSRRSTGGTSSIHTSHLEPPVSRSTSRRSTNTIPITPNEPPLLRNMSRRNSTTPIMFSSSHTKAKPPPVEKQLACTLEDLLNGCTKKIKVTRDVITNTGLIVQEEEILRIKVKPGWKKGTKITFEGMGDEKPGFLPADVIFLIAEKRHPIFKREDDDLILSVELPLVKALTGCTLSIPLLGGGKMGLSLDEIVCPGYQKIIPGQGMPNTRDHGKRGDLRVKFRITFPTQLSDEQRSDVVNILQYCS